MRRLFQDNGGTMSVPELFHVLIISELQETVDELKKICVRLGCRVALAHSTEAGLESLTAGHYDAVFADLCVRSAGGRGVAHMVKLFKLPASVFILTGWKGTLDQTLLLSEGIRGVLRKPFTSNEIRDALATLR
jgi:CheY-like chemotaxis protein